MRRVAPGQQAGSRRRAVVRVLVGLAVAAVALLAHEVLWGKLFPISPVAVGFSKHELARSIWYVQEGASLGDLGRLDGVVPQVEASHGLRFIHKPRLFVFRDDASYRRRSLSRARFCAFPTNVLVISPWALREAREGKISLPVYLRHELSHVLIFQHAGLTRSLRLPKWLLEGLATYTARQMGTSFYPDREQTYRMLREGSFMPPPLFGTRAGDRVELRVKYPDAFVYSEFACLVDYLVETRGRDTLRGYLERLIAGERQAAAFEASYAMSLDRAVDEFLQHVRGDGPGAPRP
jgi:hypothetical protein